MELKKIYSSILLVLSFFSTFFISCHKEDRDSVKPTVNILLPRQGDTLYLDSTSIFKGEFWDDQGLSSYFVQISDPSIPYDKRIVLNANTTLINADSLIYLNEIIQTSNIYDIKDTVTTVSNSFRLDTVGYYNGRGPFPTKTGSYQFKVVVIDKAGNKDSSMFDIQVALPPSLSKQ